MMVAPVDQNVIAQTHAAISAAQAAWASADHAYWQLWATLAGVAANSVVLAAIVIVQRQQQQSDRRSKSYAASIGLSHSLELLTIMFETLSQTDINNALIRFDRLRLQLTMARERVGALPHDLDDAFLMSDIVNAETAIQGLLYQLEQIERGTSRKVVGEFLAITKPIQDDVLQVFDQMKSRYPRR